MVFSKPIIECREISYKQAVLLSASVVVALASLAISTAGFARAFDRVKNWHCGLILTGGLATAAALTALGFQRPKKVDVVEDDEEETRTVELLENFLDLPAADFDELQYGSPVSYSLAEILTAMRLTPADFEDITRFQIKKALASFLTLLPLMTTKISELDPDFVLDPTDYPKVGLISRFEFKGADGRKAELDVNNDILHQLTASYLQQIGESFGEAEMKRQERSALIFIQAYNELKACRDID